MKHQEHFNRPIVDFIGRLLGREKCNCVLHVPRVSDQWGECGRRRILDSSSYTIAGTFGDPIWICGSCYLQDPEFFDNWSRDRRDFILRVEKEQPELLQASKKVCAKLGRL